MTSERKESSGELDPVQIWASMILQEGKDAALEIAEACGVEAALDAMNHIAYERYLETLRLKERLQVTDEMIDRAAVEMNSWCGPVPGDVEGFRHYAERVLRAALEVTDDQ